MVSLKTFLIFYLPLLFLGSHISLAQISSDVIERNYIDQKQWYIGAPATNKILAHSALGFEGASNSISNSFIKASIFKGTISDIVKDDVSARLKKTNRLGTELSFSLNGIYHKKAISYLAGIGHRELVNAGFASPLFETIFRGNKMYAGQKTSLGPSNISYLNYDYLYLGISKSIKEHSSFYASIQFIRGGQWLNANLYKADMYTQADGEYIELNTKLKINYSNNSSQTFPSTSGLGTALNLGFSKFNDKNRINVEIRDIGFINWENQTVFEVDSNYRYEGVEINNLIKPQILNNTTINIDSLASEFNVSKYSKNITQFLPALFLLNYTYKWSEKVNMLVGVKYMSKANYLPKVTLRGYFAIAPSFQLIPSISYGGYANQAIEIGVFKSFKNSFVVSTNIFLAEFLIIPKHSSGGGLNFSLSKVF